MFCIFNYDCINSIFFTLFFKLKKKILLIVSKYENYRKKLRCNPIDVYAYLLQIQVYGCRLRWSDYTLQTKSNEMQYIYKEQLHQIEYMA